MLVIPKVHHIGTKTQRFYRFDTRSFYFSAAPKNFPEIDFPFNVGFNDNFKYYKQQMTRSSKLMLFLRRRPLSA